MVEVIALSTMGTFVAVAIIIALLHYRHKNNLISQALKDGSDPILVRYLFTETTSLTDYLTIEYLKLKENNKDAN